MVPDAKPPLPLTQSHSRRSAAARSPATSRPQVSTRLGHLGGPARVAHRSAAIACPKGAMHPAGCGIGFRAPPVARILATPPGIARLGVHPQKYMGGGPAPRAAGPPAARRDPVGLSAVPPLHDPRGRVPERAGATHGLRAAV